MFIIRLTAALGVLLVASAVANAQVATYKQKRECFDVAAKEARMVGSVGTTDPVMARILQNNGTVNGPVTRYRDGWTVGEIWSDPTGASRQCMYTTDYSEREITAPALRSF